MSRKVINYGGYEREKPGRPLWKSVVMLIILLFLIRACGDSNDAATTTAKPNATATVAPTAVPDYTTMPANKAARIITTAANSRTCNMRTVEVFDNEIYIDVDINASLMDEQNILVNVIRYTIDVARDIYDCKGCNSAVFRFHEPGRDKYGNAIDLTTITLRLNKTTVQKMNLDYFHEYAPTKQKAFFDVCDSHSMYKEYKDAMR